MGIGGSDISYALNFVDTIELINSKGEDSMYTWQMHVYIKLVTLCWNSTAKTAKLLNIVTFQAFC